MPVNPDEDVEELDLELIALQREAGLLSVRAVIALLKDPDPGDPYDYDYRQRLFGEHAGYDGGLPAQIERGAVTAYLLAYARTGSYTAAAAHTKYSASRWSDIRKRDLESDGGGDFTEMLVVARDVHAEAIYEAAHSIAFHGSAEVIWHGGRAVGLKRVRNARLIELILKRKHPDFREEKLLDIAKAGGVLVVGGIMERAAWEAEHGDS